MIARLSRPMHGWKPESPHWFGVPLVLLLLLHCGGTNTNFECGVGVTTPGATIPKGDIVLENGSSLEIFCNLNPNHIDAKGRNASDLVFYRNEDLVPKEFIEVINYTTIRLFKKDPPMSNTIYQCKLRASPTETGVCLNSVAIGTKPQEVLNFTCVSHNWENLTCTWTKPENPIKTHYKLRFHLPGRAGARMMFSCPNIGKEKHTEIRKLVKEDQDYCFWDQGTEPPYRQPYEYYYFSMIGENTLGVVNFNIIKFHHYSHVIPSPPKDLQKVQATTNSLVFKWDVLFPMLNFPPGVNHKVEYQSQWVHNSTLWELADTSVLDVHNKSHVFHLDKLPYANTIYDIRVFMRSTVAVGEDKWSLPATLTMKTIKTVPSLPPLTNIGSFEINICLPVRDVYVYWQYIPKTLYNGDHFEYKVISVKENGIEKNLSVTPSEITKSYAKFKGISLYSNYLFTISSLNEMGLSDTSSEVLVPSKRESPAEPISFTKIAFEEGVFELSWKPPKHHSDAIEIVSYTIFWCQNERDRPYQCMGLLNWTQVPNNTFVKNITVPEENIYQFAISANSHNASSGMVWASCTVIPNKVMGKMKSVWINQIGSTYIELGWKLECSDRIGTVEGFIIKYCPIVSPKNLSCKEPFQEESRNADQTLVHSRINNLKPYTTYMVTIAIKTKHGVGLPSDPLFNTTYEAAPDQPQHLTVSSITNTSIKLEWEPPPSTNGKLQYYEVHYNDKVIRLEAENLKVLETTVENLTSYMTYNVSVTACSVACSNKSVPVTFRTAIGMAGQMESPVVRFINSSQVLVSWKPPFIPGGLLNYYQVSVRQSDDVKNSSVHFYNSTGNESQIPIPDCDQEGSHQKYTFMVRAVNIDQQNRTYLGPWSEAGENSCYKTGPTSRDRVAIWVIGIIVLVIISAAFAYMGKRVWLRCKEMQDVEVKLPPGLVINQPVSDKEKDPGNHIKISWPDGDCHGLHMAGSKSRSNISADEELLLQNKEERHGRNPSGDSSGCSSGHESVSSSLTSGTQISSDSGTEVDQHPPSPDGVFVESPPWDHRTSVIHRNKSADPYVKMGKSTGSVARSTPNLTDVEAAGAGYSCLGTWSSTGYISMPSSEEMGSTGGPEAAPYCRVGLVDASSVPGVPSQQPQAAQVSPGKGYVILPNLTDTSSSGSSPQLSPHLQIPQAQGYVTHPAPWTSPKETPRGYVMAGEQPTDKPVLTSLLGAAPREEEDILELDGTEGDSWSPESYCLFGIRPVQANEGDLLAMECNAPKPSSGYVSHPPDLMGIGGGSTAGAAGSYVPHRRFEKGDGLPLTPTAFQDHTDESYATMISTDDDTSPTTNV